MNPFDLRGPEFLLFYGTTTLLTVLVSAAVRVTLEDRDPPKLGVIDPYLVAYLRGGANEALRVAALTLVDRGLLIAYGEKLVCAPEARAGQVRRPIERALLDFFAAPGSGVHPSIGAKASHEMYRERALLESCERYQHELEALGLLPDRGTRSHRAWLGLVAITVVVGIGGTKLWIALGRGHHNVMGLVAIALVGTLALVPVVWPRRTRVGTRLLTDLREMMRTLATRAPLIRRGGQTQELALLAGVFGVGAIPETLVPHVHELFPRAPRGRDSSGCGSSCSHVSCGSSSCGGGGGGCGGGCGGCGGG